MTTYSPGSNLVSLLDNIRQVLNDNSLIDSTSNMNFNDAISSMSTSWQGHLLDGATAFSNLSRDLNNVYAED